MKGIFAQTSPDHTRRPLIISEGQKASLRSFPNSAQLASASSEAPWLLTWTGCSRCRPGRGRPSGSSPNSFWEKSGLLRRGINLLPGAAGRELGEGMMTSESTRDRKRETSRAACFRLQNPGSTPVTPLHSLFPAANVPLPCFPNSKIAVPHVSSTLESQHNL